jgi:hypothetical protein
MPRTCKRKKGETPSMVVRCLVVFLGRVAEKNEGSDAFHTCQEAKKTKT